MKKNNQSNTAQFSNAARRRFIKQELIRNAELNPNLSYPNAIARVRGRTSPNFPENRGYLENLANKRFIQDPLDLSIVNRAMQDINRETLVDKLESGRTLVKRNSYTADTTQEAKRLWRVEEGYNRTPTSVNTRMPVPRTRRELNDPVSGIVTMHTHPKAYENTHRPSVADLNHVNSVVNTDYWTSTRPENYRTRNTASYVVAVEPDTPNNPKITELRQLRRAAKLPNRPEVQRYVNQGQRLPQKTGYSWKTYQS